MSRADPRKSLSLTAKKVHRAKVSACNATFRVVVTIWRKYVARQQRQSLVINGGAADVVPYQVELSRQRSSHGGRQRRKLRA